MFVVILFRSLITDRSEVKDFEVKIDESYLWGHQSCLQRRLPKSQSNANLKNQCRFSIFDFKSDLVNLIPRCIFSLFLQNLIGFMFWAVKMTIFYKNMAIWSCDALFHSKSIAFDNAIGFEQKSMTTPSGRNDFFQKFYQWRHNDRKWSKSSNSCTNLVNGRIFSQSSQK